MSTRNWKDALFCYEKAIENSKFFFQAKISNNINEFEASLDKSEFINGITMNKEKVNNNYNNKLNSFHSGYFTVSKKNSDLLNTLK